MKFNLKNRPKIPSYYSGSEKQIRDEQWTHLLGCYKWFEGFEKEMRESLAYHDKMIDHWENKVSESHPLYRYREQIAGEWRVARGILTAVLGVEPKVKEEK